MPHRKRAATANAGDAHEILIALGALKVIKKILNHLGHPVLPPKLRPARGPPDLEQTDLIKPPPQLRD